MNYYRLHIGDYLRDTAHLSLLEHGVYARLLQVYYTRESAIPDTEKYRVIGARAADEREAVDAVLREFFVLTDSGWTQRRCDREIAEYQAKAERNRESGRNGGRPPAMRNPAETQTVSTTNPAETQTVSTTNPDITLASSQEPVAKKEQEQRSARDRAPASGGCRIPDGFPDPGAIAWCRGERPDLEPSALAARFRDHWAAQPGQRGRKADWPATWRNWVRSERGPPARAAPTAHERRAAVVARLTGGLMGSTPPDPRIIDVEPAVTAAGRTPRLAAGSG